VSIEEFINKVLKLSKREFSRLRLLDFEAETISTDCMGLIYLLMSHQKVLPPEISQASKVKDLFDLALKAQYEQSVLEVQKHDLLMWKKDNPPQSGDTGHVLLAMDKPQKISPTLFKLKILEVSRFSNGPVQREVTLQVTEQGRITGIQWHPDSKKIKQTKIIIYKAFKRKKCQGCLRASATCLCQYLPKDKWERPPFQIIQDQRERKVSLRSTQILDLCFDSPNELYTGPTKVEPESVLVFPDQEAQSLENQEDFSSLQGKKLIFLDGSWKQVKAIMLSNPSLRGLKKIKFERNCPPLYKIRKAPSEQHYSTLESFSYLWSGIYPAEASKANQLNEIFSFMIEKQIELMGRKVYEENYSHYPGYST
jgi:DTW domain-containing protein YfiP